MSEIDHYLDELFDRLAGQGAVGRRALIEAEDHLRAAATDAVARGVPVVAAERDAVVRFGSAAVVAARLRSAHSAGLHSRALSVGWLVAGLAASGFGVACLAAAGWRGEQAMAACSNFLAPSCARIGEPVGHAIWSAAVAAAVGAALLLGRWLAVRYAGLVPVHRGLAQAVGMAISLAVVVVVVAGWVPAFPAGLLNRLFDLPPLWGWGWPRLVVAAALIECLAAAVSLADPRPRRYLP